MVDAVEHFRTVDVGVDPPAGVYRIKGRVAVATGRGVRGYVVHVVGRSVHVTSAPARETRSELVAIGMHLDVDAVRARVEHALRPDQAPDAAGFARLQRHRRLSA
ncbi:GTP-binding protein [Isoptericola sp. BMS4]|uniref:GTP-binding protein n=1 Tax=Isoptericola sp. BMS4 TaxID=2527875 RepID=UPI001F11554C|nr:GTP-binding protein [Isoptericola sp. BMS4]